MSRQQDTTDNPPFFHRSSFDPSSELTPSPNEETGSSRGLRLPGHEIRGNVNPLDYPLTRGYPHRSSSSGSSSLSSPMSPFDYPRSAHQRSNSPFPSSSGHFLHSGSRSLSSDSSYPYLQGAHTFSQAPIQSGRADPLSPGSAGNYNGGYNSGINPSLPFSPPPPEFDTIPPSMDRSPYHTSSLPSGLSHSIPSAMPGYPSRGMPSAYHNPSYQPSTTGRRPSYPLVHPGFDPSIPQLPMPVPPSTTHPVWQSSHYQGSAMGYPSPSASSLQGQSSLPRIDTTLAASQQPVWSRTGSRSDSSPSVSSGLRVHSDLVTSPSPIDSRDAGSPASSSSSSSVTFVPFQPGQPEASLLAHKITEDKSLSEDVINELFPSSSQWQPPPSANNKPVGKKWICQWPGCKKPVRRQDRMAHALEHNGRKRFQCSCGHAFARTQDKRRHLREQATCRTCLRPVGRNGVDGVCSACLAEQAKKK